MAQQGKSSTKNRKAITRKDQPRALAISEQGIRTGADFANVMSALIGDLISGRVTPQVGNAACNVGGKLLKVVEMQMKYGTTVGGSSEKVLQLANVQVSNG